MVKTECKRWIVQNDDVKLPLEVQRKLDDWNRINPFELVLYFDDESNRWQFYRVKTKSATEKDDILHWQMSAPREGTDISPGIFDWLKQFDTSQGGFLSQDELRKNWIKDWKRLQYEQKQQKQKEREDFYYGVNDFILNKLRGLREQVSIPVTVGWDTQKNSPVMAVPKGTGNRMKKQEKKINV